MKDELPFKVTKYKDLKEVGKKPPKKESTRKNKGKKKTKRKKNNKLSGAESNDNFSEIYDCIILEVPYHRQLVSYKKWQNCENFQKLSSMIPL